MAAPSIDAALLLTGRLVANATDIPGAYPHGGVELGLVGEVELLLPGQFRVIWREEDNAPEEIIWLGGPVELTVSFKSFDTDFVSRFLRGGDSAGKHTFLSPEIGKAVTPLTNVVFSPFDTTHPKTVLETVVAVPLSSSPIAMSAYRWSEWRIRLWAMNAKGYTDA